MLPFHQQMVEELVESDGLTILAAGLGLITVRTKVLFSNGGGGEGLCGNWR